MDCFSNPQKRISRWLLLSLLFVIKLSQAASIFDGYSLGFYNPRISIWGYEGTLGLAKGDGLLPLLGNEDNVILSDFQAKYATDDSALLSIGLGYRHIDNNARILGAYLFADENRSIQHKNFWFLSPGIESLGNLWDFHGNAYFPISTQRQFAGTAFADQIENYNFVNFTGHEQYDHLFDRFNEVGPGADAEIGRVVPGLKNLRIFVGGYYFSLHDISNMKGAEGRLEYHVNRYITLEGTDSYDNIFHNSAELGVRFTLGGINPNNTSTLIENRILDPIIRNVSTISSGSGAPIINVYHDQGKSILERNNIYFFTANDAVNSNSTIDPNSCTYEHPCSSSDFTQTNINLINNFVPDANFYLAGESYPLNGQLILQNGQSVWGRTNDYTQPASGNDRPILTGSLALTDNNTLDSLQVMNNDTQIIGIDVNNANNITINNLAIGGNNNTQSYETAINLNNAQNINITNSNINTIINTSSEAVGILANNSNFNVENSTINIVTNSSNDSINTFGIKANNSIFTINNSNIIDTINATNSSNVNATGIAADNSDIKINNSTIAASAITDTNANGIFENATALSIGNSNLHIQNSTVATNAIANDSDGSIFLGAFGIDSADSQIEALNNNFNINAQSIGSPATMTISIGIHTAGGNLIQSGNNFNVTATCSTWNCMVENIYEETSLI